MSSLNKIIEILKPVSKLEVSENLDGIDNLYELVNVILPNNTLIYDSEIIDENNAYKSLILRYASITDNEWDPSNIHVSGEINNKLKITTYILDKEINWNIAQDGSDYVSDTFLQQISLFSSNHLPGEFVHIPTNDQLISVVYLPKAVAKRFKSITSKILTIDIACKAIKNNDKELISKSWFDNALHNTKGILEARDSEGDTLYTSSIKGGDSNYVQYLKDIGADLVCPGSEGKTPLQIAKECNNEEEIEYLEDSYFNMEANGWDSVNTILREHPDGFNENIKNLVRDIQKSEYKNLLYPYLCPYVRDPLYIGIKPQYFMGDNVISVHGFNSMDELILSFSTTGKNSMYVNIRCNHDEALTYVDRLCAIARSTD